MTSTLTGYPNPLAHRRALPVHDSDIAAALRSEISARLVAMHRFRRERDNAHGAAIDFCDWRADDEQSTVCFLLNLWRITRRNARQPARRLGADIETLVADERKEVDCGY